MENCFKCESRKRAWLSTVAHLKTVWRCWLLAFLLSSVFCSALPAGSRRSFKQMDPGLATGAGLHRPVRHLPLLLRPDRVQRLHLRQPPHVPGHPLTSPASTWAPPSSSSSRSRGGISTWFPVFRHFGTKSVFRDWVERSKASAFILRCKTQRSWGEGVGVVVQFGVF